MSCGLVLVMAGLRGLAVTGILQESIDSKSESMVEDLLVIGLCVV